MSKGVSNPDCIHVRKTRNVSILGNERFTDHLIIMHRTLISNTHTHTHKHFMENKWRALNTFHKDKKIQAKRCVFSFS